MYELPERTSWLEPPAYEEIGRCSHCGEEIYEGDDIWEICGDWYCERCIDSFRKEAEMIENFEYSM